MEPVELAAALLVALAATASLFLAVALLVEAALAGSTDEVLKSKRLSRSAIPAFIVLAALVGVGTLFRSAIFLAVGVTEVLIDVSPLVLAVAGALLLGLRVAAPDGEALAVVSHRRVRRFMVAALVLLTIYVPGVLLGTVFAGPYSNDLHDLRALLSIVGHYGSLLALGGFVIGSAASAVFAFAVARLVSLATARRPSSRPPLVFGLVAGAVVASAVMVLAVVMYGVG